MMSQANKQIVVRKPMRKVHEEEGCSLVLRAIGAAKGNRVGDMENQQSAHRPI
jgi:hypothetical protein